MVTKIITFPPEYIKRKKQFLLSSLVTAVLPEVCAVQNKGILFALKHIIGSFGHFIKARFIKRKKIHMYERARLKEMAPFSSIPLRNNKSSINHLMKT